MPLERNNFDRKIFKLGALVAGPLLLAACQGTTTEQKTPLGPTSTTTSGQPLTTQEPAIQPPNIVTPQRLITPTPFSELFGEEPPKNPTPPKSSTKYEKVHIPLPNADTANYYEQNEYYVYTGIGYEDLEENIDILKPVYRESTFANLTTYIQEAKRLDAINSKDPQIMQNLSFAAGIVLGSCERNKYSREYLRLLASLVYEKYPTTNDKYRLGFFELPLIDCEIFSAKL